MTAIQELMLLVCFGAVTCVFVCELVFIIVSAVKWVKKKVRERKERKTSETKAD